MKIGQMTFNEILNEVAGSNPTPGGGCVAALAGALAAALGVMVGRFTLGREKYRESWPEMEKMIPVADRLTRELTILGDKDCEAYELVAKAFKMPRGTESEKAARQAATEEGTRQAALAPMNTLKKLTEIFGLVETAVQSGNPNCLTDAGVAAQLTRAAAFGAAYNVQINLTSLPQSDFTDNLSKETGLLLENLTTRFNSLETTIHLRLEMPVY